LNVIVECFKRFPLTEHQIAIRDAIEVAVDGLFVPEKLKSPLSNGDLRNGRDLPVDTITRLQMIKPAHMTPVLAALRKQLRIAKCAEKDAARSNPIKAMAQRRLILPNATSDAIEAVIFYIYASKLEHDSAGQLCNTLHLAEQLEIRQLAKQCTEKLLESTTTMLDVAKSNNYPLYELLVDKKRDKEDPNDLVPEVVFIRAVFEYVLRRPKPPIELKNMVINAIIEAEDPALVTELLPKMQLEFRGDILKALYGAPNRRAKKSSTH
jgi:hypothetical protein